MLTDAGAGAGAVRRCAKCQRFREWNDGRAWRNRTGRSPICPECSRAYMAEYRNANRDAVRSHSLRWARANRDEQNQRARERYPVVRDTVNARRRERYAGRPVDQERRDAVNARRRARYAERRDEINARRRRRPGTA